MQKFIELFQTLEERAVCKIACENSLKVFIKIVHKFRTGADFVFKDFHNDIIKALEQRAFYIIKKNLLINIPVGFGKSLIVQYFTSWCFCRNKNNTFLYTSYSDNLIVKHSGEIKEILLSEVCEVLWGYEFQKDKKSKSNWSILGGMGRSGLTAGAIGGTITGLDGGNPAVKGFCGAIAIDDPIKATDIIYETKRDDCVYKYENAIKTRKRRDDVPIIIIMQRLHEEDLTGYIKREGKYGIDKSTGKELSEKEKNEWKKEWDCITIEALKNEKSIWEEKISTKSLIKLREEQPWTFESQYQQRPDSNVNSSFKGVKYATKEEEELIKNGYGHIDKGFDGDDGTAFAIIKKVGEFYYVFGKLWQKHIDDCMSEIKALRKKYLCGNIRTEKNDDKGYLAKNYDFIISYSEYHNKHDKIMTYLYPEWKNIKFLIGTDISYIKQIQHYNEKAKHDDAPDNLASILRFLNSNYTELIGSRPF